MFRVIGVVLAWLPTIIAVVSAIEQLSSDKTGPEKKDIALAALYRVLSQAGVELSTGTRTVISSVVDAMVAVLNFLGVGGLKEDEDETPETELLVVSYLEEANAHEAEAAEITAARAAEVDEVLSMASENEGRLNELEALFNE